jgi:adenylosuccinate synthase
LDVGKSVLLEGTQGFMLSLFLGGGYPYVTGRDTGASAIVEAGVGPTRVEDNSLQVPITRVEQDPTWRDNQRSPETWLVEARGTGRDRRSAHSIWPKTLK